MELKCYDSSKITDKLLIQGRIGKITERGIPLFWTGSAVEINVTGRQLWFEYECPKRIVGIYLRIEVDDADIARFMITEGVNKVCAFGNLDESTVKKVRIYREMQAHAPIIIKSFYTDGELCPITQRKHKIEFIGDSVTAGEGLAGNTKHNNWDPFVFSSRGHYALTVAKELNADYSILALSGYGVHAACDNNPNEVIQKYYDTVCGRSDDEIQTSLGSQDKFDFSTDRTDITVVNLGSNDGGAFNSEPWIDADGVKHKHQLGEDGKPCERDYKLIKQSIIDFCKVIHQSRPDGYIFWCYDMLNDIINETIIDAINEYRETQNDNKAFSVKIARADDTCIGARWHPGAKAHAIYADSLIKQIRETIEI